MLLASLQAAATGLTGWRIEPSEGGLVRLSAAGADWQPRRWVELATRVFTDGVTRALVGTRAMLGEGWDAPCVNCLVDLSTATTAVSVQQSRGRALRLDPADPEKIASNWDIICVAPELTRGIGDYQRFVRKHLHVFAPSEDGAIEAGPSHVHPALGPFAPPPDSEFAQINRSMVERTVRRELVRQRWRIGEPYQGAELQTLLIRGRHQTHQPPAQVRPKPPSYPVDQRLTLSLAALSLVAAVIGGLVQSVALGVAALVVLAGSLGWVLSRLGHVRASLPDALPLDLVAQSICDCYLQLGQFSEQAARSLTIEPRASGYLRCYLRDASPAENELFSEALDNVLCPADFPRYLVSRLVPGRRNAAALLGRAVARKPPFDHRWAAVPADFGRSKQRAEAFHAAWTRWLGPSELQFTQRSTAGRDAAAEASAEQADFSTSRRQVWV